MTEFQQFIVIRHGESETNATNTFQAGNHHEAVTMSTDDYRRLAQPGIGRFTIHA